MHADGHGCRGSTRIHSSESVSIRVHLRFNFLKRRANQDITRKRRSASPSRISHEIRYWKRLHRFLAGFSCRRLYWGLMKIQYVLGMVAAALIAPAFGQEIPKTL